MKMPPDWCYFFERFESSPSEMKDRKTCGGFDEKKQAAGYIALLMVNNLLPLGIYYTKIVPGILLFYTINCFLNI
jgi:hypothetical protein